MSASSDRQGSSSASSVAPANLAAVVECEKCKRHQHGLANKDTLPFYHLDLPSAARPDTQDAWSKKLKDRMPSCRQFICICLVTALLSSAYVGRPGSFRP